MDGVLVIDKPAGMTSHDVVAQVRRILRERSVGHLGTLDPMATGVLPLVLGRYTRLAQFYAAADKTYEGTIRLGLATDTYDSDGEPAGTPQVFDGALDDLRLAAARFTGDIQQLPPPFSAKKIAGVPAYKLARKKREVELKQVRVFVRRFEILGLQGNEADFVAEVSAGTYVRSLAHDLGRELGIGAHLSSLRRTQSAEFALEDGTTIEKLASSLASNDILQNMHYRTLPLDWCKGFIHPRRILPDMPAVTVTDELAAAISHGRSVNLPELSGAKRVKVFYGRDDLIAIASRVAGTLFHPGTVLMSASLSGVNS